MEFQERNEERNKEVEELTLLASKKEGWRMELQSRDHPTIFLLIQGEMKRNGMNGYKGREKG